MRFAGGPVCLVRAVAVMVVWVWAGSVHAADAPTAKIASVQNSVESRTGTGSWGAATVSQPLFAKDRVRTGAASRAAILYSDRTLHRMDEKSEVEIEAPTPSSSGVLRVLAGNHYFSSRTPKDYGRIETPTVTAAIKGTEFVVQVAADSTTTITMLEGTVEASNAAGSVTVGKGEAAYAEPGKAPVKRTVVRPRDAVAWALYYPPVLGGSDAQRLAAAGGDGAKLAEAARLLAAGQAAQAKPLVEGVLASRPEDATALALSSTIATAEGKKDEASQLADRAMKADPKSAAAALAGSFAAQSRFDIAAARDLAEKAAALDPGSSAALARAAELRMAEGDLDGARAAADEAVRREPREARALAVLGFALLTEYRSADAEKSFEQAVAADPSLGLAHLGLGIARIRRGKVTAGREEIQTAAALDPEDALARSYLGKAWYEERRSKEAEKEFAAAKQADPNDPTPWLYDAIAKQNENRPVEALGDLQQSADRNDRRAVYRSRLLLDQDAAVRSSDLARIYNDLGFDALGLVAARRSADEDQANFSSHNLLAGGYRYLPGYASSYLSEVLQARIYQPVGVNAVRPDAIGETVSFNEYTALFDRPRARAFGNFSFGETETSLDKIYGPTQQCFDPLTSASALCRDLYRQDQSRSGEANLIGTYNGDRYAGAIQYRRSYDEGIRFNADQAATTYRGFFQFAPSWKDSFQLNVQYGEQTFGDLPLREFPFLVSYERFDTKLTNIAAGYHRKLTPSSDLAAVVTWNETEQTGENLLVPGQGKATLSGPQAEVQDVIRGKNATWILGVGGFDGKEKLESGSTAMESADRYANAYGLGKLRGLGPVEFTVGLAVENVDAPAGLIPPRDSGIAPGDVSYRHTQLSPKLGVAAYLKSRTTLRAAWFERLAPAIGRIQSLEPTQVSGFNQVFDDAGGTRSRSWGVGFDQEVVHQVFFGASWMRRDRTIPQGYCAIEDPFSGCAFQQATLISEKTSKDDLGSAYVDATVWKYFALSLAYERDKSRYDYTDVTQTALFQNHLETERIAPQAKFFLPMGLFAGVKGTRYRQWADQYDSLDPATATYLPQHADFWSVDAQLGWRLPRRYGTVSLEGRNLSDRRFTFYDRAVQETVLPARTILLRAILTY